MVETLYKHKFVIDTQNSQDSSHFLLRAEKNSKFSPVGCECCLAANEELDVSEEKMTAQSQHLSKNR